MKKLTIIVLFLSMFSSFSSAEVEADYIIQIGDLIRISLPGEDSLNTDFTVDNRGQLELPEVGHITVAGYNEAQLKSTVEKQLSSILKDLTGLNIYIAKKQIIINVLGYVNAPGEVLLPANANIQMALIAAGGLKPGAQLDKLHLQKGEKKLTFNYKKYLDSGDDNLLPSLNSLDTIFVPSSPMLGNIEVDFNLNNITTHGDAADRGAIKVFGEVHAQGRFAYSKDNNLVDYLMKAGGVTFYAGIEQIRVITDGKPRIFNLKQFLDTGDLNLLPEMAIGATIFVPRKAEQIKSGSNTVYVMGEVFKPGAFEGKKGATFMDILANAGGPTRFAESRRIKIIKASGEVKQFDLNSYIEGADNVSIPSMSAGDAIFVPEKNQLNSQSWLKVASNRAVRVIGAVGKPGRVEWADEMSLMDLLAQVGGPTKLADIHNIEINSPNENGQVIRTIFNLERFLNEGLSDHDLPKIRAGATINIRTLAADPTSNKSRWIRQSSENSIYLFGQVGNPGRYMFTNNMHFLDILSAANGPTEKADIRNIRITHRSSGKAQVTKVNLSLYFETGDEHLLPKVQIGDTIYIPVKDRDWLDKPKEVMVRVLGSVNKPGRYNFDDSMTLLDLLAQAGGTSTTAYIEKITVVNLSCCRSQARVFNLAKFAKTADFASLPVIRAGDTVFVPDQSLSSISKARSGLQDIFQMVTLASLLGLL